MKIHASFLLVLHLAYLSHAANILILEEVPSPIHEIWFQVVATGLAEKGHNITIVSANVHIKDDVSRENVHYIIMDKVLETLYSNLNDQGDGDILNSFNYQILQGYKFSKALCKGFLKSSGWEILTTYPDDFKFDLIIHDYIVGSCLLNIMQKFSNAPLVSMTAFNDNTVFPSIVKSSAIPALNPYPLLSKFPITITDRILTSLVQNSLHFNSFTSVCESSKQSILYLINYDPAVDGPQQLPPNVIGVGGLLIGETEPLPDGLQSIVDKSVDGVILFSLGNLRSQQMGEVGLSNILEVFGEFPTYTFFWKMDLEKFSMPIPENVYVQDSLPLKDILALNKTKLFISLGDLMSTQEAIWHAKPMLGIVLSDSQFSNIEKSVDRGVAESLYYNEFSKENLKGKLDLLLTNPKYQDNIQVASKAFRDQKETPLERAIWWIEWAIRNPRVTYFKGNEQNLNFWQVDSVDVYAVLMIILYTSLCIFVWISFKLVKIFKSMKSPKSQAPVTKTKKQKQK